MCAVRAGIDGESEGISCNKKLHATGREERVDKGLIRVICDAPRHLLTVIVCPPTHVTRLLQCNAFSNARKDGIELERHLTELQPQLEMVLLIHTALRIQSTNWMRPPTPLASSFPRHTAMVSSKSLPLFPAAVDK